jgi:hypothetical protein
MSSSSTDRERDLERLVRDLALVDPPPFPPGQRVDRNAWDAALAATLQDTRATRPEQVYAETQARLDRFYNRPAAVEPRPPAAAVPGAAVKVNPFSELGVMGIVAQFLGVATEGRRLLATTSMDLRLRALSHYAANPVVPVAPTAALRSSAHLRVAQVDWDANDPIPLPRWTTTIRVTTASLVAGLNSGAFARMPFVTTITGYDDPDRDVHSSALVLGGLFPPNLTSLSLGASFDMPLSAVLPASLHTLTMGVYFNQPLPAELPASLHTLTMGARFDKPLPAVLPASLHTLTMGYCFNQPLPAVLPASLHTLTMGSFFRQPLPAVLPASLHTLTLGARFTHPLPAVLPASLHTLTLGSSFNHPLPAVLPASLHILTLGASFNHPLPAVLPASLDVVHGW